ncbi:DUF1707 SHOCT-like domain-containing protein [Marinitenerispora sediminis]|uniref:DUF1707 domain-containing protein n=1 Tax=Marinitenerispora sediminis TaxID=1931232 RepID=A0A368T6N5_9ACTN|nr:DUF1707 domain-containing protein [Marinitenerispora sediminis]RCV50665.1 hypothetical protein DEF28_17470 [Marinitenerispora sediminis]RCV56217.1 hypothetical protein DEF23_13055 [Marinitenerispora sediminis]RCV59448.1 hypothetical protein DEF24_09725 [Marinitenerispora sediminis]
MRASDRDRDAVAERLAAALSEGRLALAEYEQRLDTAMSAQTMGELEPLTADLPEQSAAAPAPEERATGGAGEVSPWREWLDEWRYWLGGAIIMTGIWAVTSVVGGRPLQFWPLIPLGIWAAVLVAGLVWPDDEKKSGKKKNGEKAAGTDA